MLRLLIGLLLALALLFSSACVSRLKVDWTIRSVGASIEAPAEESTP